MLTCFNCQFFSQNWDIKTLESIHQHAFSHQISYNYSASIYPTVSILPLGAIASGYLYKNEKLFDTGIASMTALGVSYVSTQIIKYSVQRPRPFETYAHLNPYYLPSGYSFNSGHTALAFSLATTLSINYPHWYVIVPAYAYAVGMGYSRMHLGVHYPSDVLMGAALGVGTSLLTHYTLKWIKEKSFYPQLSRFNKDKSLSLALSPIYGLDNP